MYEVIILALNTLEKVNFGSLHVNQTEIKWQSNVILILKLKLNGFMHSCLKQL